MMCLTICLLALVDSRKLYTRKLIHAEINTYKAYLNCHTPGKQLPYPREATTIPEGSNYHTRGKQLPYPREATTIPQGSNYHTPGKQLPYPREATTIPQGCITIVCLHLYSAINSLVNLTKGINAFHNNIFAVGVFIDVLLTQLTTISYYVNSTTMVLEIT